MREKIAQEKKKKPYVTPGLTVHGDIGSLTETVGNAGGPDGGCCAGGNKTA
jgi:hypothetical protein